MIVERLETFHELQRDFFIKISEETWLEINFHK